MSPMEQFGSEWFQEELLVFDALIATVAKRFAFSVEGMPKIPSRVCPTSEMPPNAMAEFLVPSPCPGIYPGVAHDRHHVDVLVGPHFQEQEVGARACPFAGRAASAGNACSIFWDFEVKLLAGLTA